MKIEHVALLVQDPVSMARWYEQHLGLKVVRSSEQRPALTRFLADSDGTTVLEIYSGTLTVPSYATMDPLLVHLAVATDDVPGTRERLLAAGATAEGEVTVTPAGDRLAMLRDPWGLALQLAQRATPLVPAGR